MRPKGKILVFDLPVRILHWLLAALFLGAFAIATTVDDESTAFALHAVLGVGAAFVVLVRLLWGLVGSRYTRLRSLSLQPRALGRYLAGVVTGRGGREIGHNPATSWFMLLMFAVVLGLALTGWRLGRGDESVEELHEALAWSGFALAAVHVAGVLWHLARRRENLVASMVTGRKAGSEAAGIPSARPAAAIVLLVLFVGLGAMLLAGYEPRSGRLTLPLFGGPLTIGEAGERDAGEAAGTTAEDPARQAGESGGDDEEGVEATADHD